MRNMFIEIMSWSEVWGIALPLAMIFWMKNRKPESLPLRIYVVLATGLNLFAVLISHYRGNWSWLPESNLFLYNIHSIARVLLFSWYFYITGHRWVRRFSIGLLPLFVGLAVIQLFFLRETNVLSARIHAAESIVLLLLCIVFLLGTVFDESPVIWMQQSSFWVCSAVSLFEAVNFLVFAFFNLFNVTEKAKHDFGLTLLLIFSFTYLLLCITLAIKLHREGRSEAVATNH